MFNARTQFAREKKKLLHNGESWNAYTSKWEFLSCKLSFPYSVHNTKHCILITFLSFFYSRAVVKQYHCFEHLLRLNNFRFWRKRFRIHHFVADPKKSPRKIYNFSFLSSVRIAHCQRTNVLEIPILVADSAITQLFNIFMLFPYISTYLYQIKSSVGRSFLSRSGCLYSNFSIFVWCSRSHTLAWDQMCEDGCLVGV